MPSASQFFQVSIWRNLGKLKPTDVRRQCLLFLSIILDKNSYHDFFIITTFNDKADKLKGFH